MNIFHWQILYQELNNHMQASDQVWLELLLPLVVAWFHRMFSFSAD